MVTSQDRPRQGHRGDGNDYQMLIAGLLACMPERELARGLGRSPSAMRDRAMATAAAAVLASGDPEDAAQFEAQTTPWIGDTANC